MSGTLYYTGTAQGGSTTTLNDNSLIQVDDFWNGYEIKILSGRNIGLIRTVSDFDDANNRLTFSVALPFAIAFGDAYTLYLSPENQIVIVGGTGRTDTTENAGINPQTSAVIPDDVIEGAYKAQAAINSSHQLITDIVNNSLNSATKQILDGFKLTQSGALNISGTQTALLSSASVGDSNIEVSSVAGFPTSGVLYLQGDTNWMRITYNNVIGNRFLGIPNSGTGSITENASFTNQVLGGPGVIITPKGIVTINSSGVETIVLEGATGNATFAGTLIAPSGTLGTITAGTLAANTVIVGTAASIIETGTLANFPSDANLVGYWAFDEGTGTIAYDNSGNSATLTLVASPSWVAGVVGKRLDFNGTTQYGTLASSVNAGTASTLSFWINIDDLTGGLVPIGESSYTNLYVVYIDPSGFVYFRIGSNYVQWTTVALAIPLTIATKYHLCFVRNGTSIELYVNGVSQGIKTNASITGNTLMSAIGAKSNGTLPTNGQIDEMRIYNTALTAAQIYALYKYPKGNAGTVISGVQLIDGTVVAAKILTANLAAISANLGTITAGNITLDTSGFIRGGQTAFDTGNQGFWFGYDSGAWKFSMAATASQRLILDSSGINISAKVQNAPGDILYQSADTLRTAADTSYTKKKEIQINRSGGYRVKFDLKLTANDPGYFAFGRVYINGVATGTERSTSDGVSWTTYSEDFLNLNSGDLIQVYCKKSAGATQNYQVSNFRLYVLRELDTSTVNLD